jgi:hypothetical protein
MQNGHLLTDTTGLRLAVIVHPASVQDRAGAEPLLRHARRLFPFVERIIDDAGYRGSTSSAAATDTKIVVLPKPWIVERSIGLEAALRAAAISVSPATSSGTAASLPPSSAWPADWRMRPERCSGSSPFENAGG